MKIQLKYVGSNQPQGMIVDVEIENVQKLLDTGDYIKLGEEKPLKKVENVEKEEEVLENGDSKRTNKRF